MQYAVNPNKSYTDGFLALCMSGQQLDPTMAQDQMHRYRVSTTTATVTIHLPQRPSFTSTISNAVLVMLTILYPQSASSFEQLPAPLASAAPNHHKHYKNITHSLTPSAFALAPGLSSPLPPHPLLSPPLPPPPPTT